MDAIQLLRRLDQHRRWVNSNLLDAAAELSEEQLRQTFPIGQGSIWKTLLHLYAAEYQWLNALQGNESPLVPGDLPGKIPGNQLGEGGIRDLADLREKWSELEKGWDAVLASITPQSLEDTVYKVITSDPAKGKFGTKRSDILLHVCTHSQYTTAQMINMLRHCGAERLPQTMLIALARIETTAPGKS